MAPSLIFDAHLDIAWNGIEWVRNLELPVAEIRKFESQFPGTIPGDCTVSYPELRRGRVGLMIATLLPRYHRRDRPLSFPQSREAAFGIAQGQLAYYRALSERGVLREISDLAAMEAHVAEWKKPASEPPLGWILSMEGSPPIRDPEQIEAWYNWGLRLLGPAHYGPSPYCFGTGSQGGFNEAGKRLLREMDRVGMLLDVTHLADESFWDALEVYQGPLLASHHNCRALVPADRQLTDEQILALVKREAVIGAAFDNWMIRPGWVIGVSDPKTVQLHHLVDHIDHICQLAGSARHCGIGSDLDGGFGKEQTPSDLDTIADLPRLGEIFAARGYSDDDIAGFFCENFLNFFRRAWAK